MAVEFEIDASELQGQINRLQSAMTPERVNQVMYGVLRRTEGHVRKILKDDLPRNYYAKPNKEIGPAVKKGRITSGGLGVGCIIPVKGARRSIGGKHIKASGGAKGWESLHKKYRVKAWIVKSGVSELPQQMDSYGGMPPFRNLSAAKLNGVTFTRKGKARFPIMKVSGIAIPQMPTNRSEYRVKIDIANYLQARMEHELQRLVGG